VGPNDRWGDGLILLFVHLLSHYTKVKSKRGNDLTELCTEEFSVQSCDICLKVVYGGLPMSGCQQCSYDLCSKCIHKKVCHVFAV